MVIKPARAGDIRNAAVRFGEQVSGGSQTRLHDELIGSQPEDALEQPRKANGGQSGETRQRPGRDGFVAVVLQILKRGHEAGWDALPIPGCPQVARDPDHADNLAERIFHWQLGREAPAGTAARVPMQFKVVDDRVAGSKHCLVLGGI